MTQQKNNKPVYPMLDRIPEGVYLGQNERVEELNEKILNRIYPDLLLNQTNSLEVNFSPRPSMTKYSRFPVLDPRVSANTPFRTHEKIHTLPVYHVGATFNPGYRGPVSGYMASVNDETILRNQAFALQGGLGRDMFVPSSNSDLYKTVIVSRPSVQPYPKLFQGFQFDQTPHQNVANYPEIGGDRFFNATRNQLRGIGNP